MVTEIIGDIFEEFENGGINVLVHQANCFHTMGGGIARVIAQKYPAAKNADQATGRGDKAKLGTYSVGELVNGRKIVNVYSQYDTSAMCNTQDDAKDRVETVMMKSMRATRYDAVVAAFETLEKAVRFSGRDYILGIPYGYGSDLAGGSWTIVRAIIQSVFGESPVKVVIVRLPNKPDLK